MTGRSQEMSDLSAHAAPARSSAEAGKQGATAGILENACEFLCACALLSMIAMIGTEVICRSFLGFSTQMADEIGGYLLVAITFLSLAFRNHITPITTSNSSSRDYHPGPS